MKDIVGQRWLANPASFLSLTGTWQTWQNPGRTFSVYALLKDDSQLSVEERIASLRPLHTPRRPYKPILGEASRRHDVSRESAPNSEVGLKGGGALCGGASLVEFVNASLHNCCRCHLCKHMHDIVSHCSPHHHSGLP